MAAEKAGEAHGTFPPFDFTLFPHQLFWFAVTFVALYFVVSRVALPRISEVVERRAAKIKSDLEGAARENEAAESAQKAAERTQAESRANARALIERLRAEAQEALAADQARIERELSEQAQAEEARIAQTRAKALSQVEAIANDVAEDIVARVVGAAPSAHSSSPQMVRA